MDGDAEKRVQVDLDRLRNLPDSLLCQILLNKPTKYVVKCCVLSKRWRILWRFVPGLDLCDDDFLEQDRLVSFVDSFLNFNSESCLQIFKLDFHSMEMDNMWTDKPPDNAHFTQWIDTVLKRKVQYLHFQNPWDCEKVEIPLTVYICESLVSLKLCEVLLPNPKSISLPCLKVIDLDEVEFVKDWAFDMLISGCPILKSLTVKRIPAVENVKVLRVCSQSLPRLILLGYHHDDDLDEELVVLIDAPKLEKLELDNCRTDRFIIKNLFSLVMISIDVNFKVSQFDPDDLPKRNMIRDFFRGISSVKDMVISSYTLEAIYNYSRCGTLPLFRNLSSLRANFYEWEMLPIFLERCPNLISVTTLKIDFQPRQRISNLPAGPHSFLPSLEYVQIVRTSSDVEGHMKLVSYFLENKTILKEFTFFLGNFRKK